MGRRGARATGSHTLDLGRGVLEELGRRSLGVGREERIGAGVRGEEAVRKEEEKGGVDEKYKDEELREEEMEKEEELG